MGKSYNTDKRDKYSKYKRPKRNKDNKNRNKWFSEDIEIE